MTAAHLIDVNRAAHDRVASKYNVCHPEIYNPTEQRRLQSALLEARASIRCANRRVLDFGAGTGNLTEKLLDSDREVWAADVSLGMLDLLGERFPHEVGQGQLKLSHLNGQLPLPFPDRHFGFVATYSVLHHVPDYLEAVRELVRVLDDGGILFIDHELNASHWNSPPAMRLYRLVTQPAYCFRRIGVRFARLWGYKEPRLPPPDQREPYEEGDIHVYADDCIDWNAIRRIAADGGMLEIPTNEYLLCRERSQIPLRYLAFRWFVSDMGMYVGCKRQ